MENLTQAEQRLLDTHPEEGAGIRQAHKTDPGDEEGLPGRGEGGDKRLREGQVRGDHGGVEIGVDDDSAEEEVSEIGGLLPQDHESDDLSGEQGGQSERLSCESGVTDSVVMVANPCANKRRGVGQVRDGEDVRGPLFVVFSRAVPGFLFLFNFKSKTRIVGE